MNKKRYIALLLAMALGIGLLAGCGGKGSQEESAAVESNAADSLNEVVGEEKILADVNAFRYTVLPEGAEITECEVIKRQTNKDDKEDIVYCRLLGPEGGYRYSQYFVRLLYNFYDDGGWILDEMTSDQEDQWGVIGYLDGDGKPIEDGMVYVGDYTKDSGVTISNTGWWENNGAVFDMQGNKVSGVTGVTRADRYTVKQGGLVYLCDSSGKKLSTGYEKIGYAGAITDDNENIIDHRWYVLKDGLLGCLDDAGKEIIPLKYDGDENWRLNFNAIDSYGNGDFGTLTTVADGNGRLVINSDGKELTRFDGDTGLWVYTYGDGYTVKDENYSGNGYHYSAYDSNGNQLFSGAYTEVCANMVGVCTTYYYNENQVYPDWIVYDWDGNQIGTVPSRHEVSAAVPLGGDLFNTEFSSYVLSNSKGYNIQDRGSWIRVYGNYIAYGSPCGVFDKDGNYIIYPEYEEIFPVGGGLYVVQKEDETAALFDWRGNQRTQFFDSIEQFSENGKYFIVQEENKLYALKNPLSETELKNAPIYDATLTVG